MPIGTARMATLCLPNAELHEGVRWDDAALGRILSDGDRTAVLLYPGDGAKDALTDPPAGPVTLVVVDGTWSQAKKIVRENPRLRALPRYAFAPPRPSEYRIRREPALTYVSTIEALVHVLGALEGGDPGRFEALLVPFRAMIDAQVACERALRGAGARHAAKKTWIRKPRVHPLLADPSLDVVCVAGEANAWPYRAREPGVTYEDDLIHWVAYRVSTGEALDRVIAPRAPLAPRTAAYVELDERTLARGVSLGDLGAAWASFVREGDVVCFWGHYAAALFARDRHASWPSRSLDLRTASRDHAKAKVGTLEEHVSRLGLEPPRSRGRGRAGRRVAQIEALVRHFRSLAEGEERAFATPAPTAR